jgi:hypothetical protein
VDWEATKKLAHPVRFKERVTLKPRQLEKPSPRPVKGKEPVENSRGLVSHIWDEWACKNFDV